MAVAAFKIEKDECEKCYTLWFDEEGVNTCLDCGRCFCDDHTSEHTHETGHGFFIHFTNPQQSEIRFFDDASYHVCELPPEYTQISKIIRAQRFVYENPHGADDAEYPMPMLSGFKDIGNTSFLNAVLHVIFSIDDLQTFFASSACERGDCGKLGFEFFRFVSELRQGNRKVMRPRLLRQQFTREYRDSTPKDAMPFFNYLFNEISIMPKSPLRDLTEFNLNWICLCDNCGFSETGTQRTHLFEIRPEFDSPETQWMHIEDCIQRSQHFKTTERQCPQCGQKAMTVMRVIDKLPPYLLIYFALDNGDEQTRHKIDVHLELDPDDLEMQRFQAAEGPSSYKMIASCHHSGKAADWGKNAAYVRYNQQWYLFRDDSVLACDRNHDFKYGKQYLYLYKLRV